MARCRRGERFSLRPTSFSRHRIYRDSARKAITGITLIAGFASTVGWPLSSPGLETIGWRETCYAWAAVHMVIGLPLNMLFLPKTPPAQRVQGSIVRPHILIDRTMILRSFAFAAGGSSQE